MMKTILSLLFLPLALFAEVGYVEPWGPGAELVTQTYTAPSAPARLSPFGKMAETAILFHQNVLTHISGPRSSYRPTSSQYMLEAIRSYGFWKGYVLGCDRLLRENGDPWVYRSKLINGKLYKWDSPADIAQTRAPTRPRHADRFSLCKKTEEAPLQTEMICETHSPDTSCTNPPSTQGD